MLRTIKKAPRPVCLGKIEGVNFLALAASRRQDFMP